MNSTIRNFFPFVIRRLSFVTVFLAFAMCVNAATPIVSVTPYAFVGRITDAAHAAFDGDKVATIAAYNASGTKLAQSTTFSRTDTRRNYTLDIPVATDAISGYAVQGDALAIVVTDSEQVEWTGVVPDAKSIVGEPGGVAEVDIVLSAPSDETGGIDYDLYWTLYMEWMESDYYDTDLEPFDPLYDHDRDGVSTIAEAQAGTNPYDAQSKLAITSFAHNEDDGEQIEFSACNSRVYIVEGATSLEAQDWRVLSFTVADSSGEQTALSYPSSNRVDKATIYVKKADFSPKFFRVRVE